MVAFREFPLAVSMQRVTNAIEEAWHVCLRSNGAPRVIASFIFKLREDPTWTDEEIRAVMAGIRTRIGEHKQSQPSVNQ